MMAYTPLTDAEITDGLSKLKGWERDGDKITKSFKFDKYLEGTAFASAIGVICEAQDHHPDLVIGYKKVQVSFSTHDAGNRLSEKDFNAAAAIDALGYPKPK
jgi:4a-hydroxytetrahydrobiopterin dehydratase